MKLPQLTAAAFSLLLFTAGSALAQAPANDMCSGAISLAGSFGQPIGTVMNTGPYDNTNATHHATDPTTGFDCFLEINSAGTAYEPTIDNSLWFSFVGDGNMYYINTGQCTPASTNYIDDGDTQIAIYTGTCGSLTPVACNEDISTSGGNYASGLNFATQAGVTYYMLIDGYRAGTTIANGEFCIMVEQKAMISCTNPSVTAGSTVSNTNVLCQSDTLVITNSGAFAPNVGTYYGASWIVSEADLQGNSSNINASMVASYNIVSAPPANTNFAFINNGSFIGSSPDLPYGTYYFTRVIFGNATLNPAATNDTYFHTLIPDVNCTFLGASQMVTIYPPNDPACMVSAPSAITSAFSINSLYPVPVQNELNVSLSSIENTTVTVLVRDVLGRVTASKNFSAVAGANNINVNLNNQPAGVYSVTITDGSNVAVSKFVKE